MAWVTYSFFAVNTETGICVPLPAFDAPAPCKRQAQAEKTLRSRPAADCVRLAGTRLLECVSGREIASGVEAFWRGKRLWVRRGGRLEVLSSQNGGEREWRFCDAGIVAQDVWHVDRADRVCVDGILHEPVEIPLVKPCKNPELDLYAASIRQLCNRPYAGHRPRRTTFPWPRVHLQMDHGYLLTGISGPWRVQTTFWVQVDFDFDTPPGRSEQKPRTATAARMQALCSAANRLLAAARWNRDPGTSARLQLQLRSLIERIRNASGDFPDSREQEDFR